MSQDRQVDREESCPQKVGGVHFHCDACDACSGPVPDLPDDWWRIEATKRRKSLPRAGPCYWACPACAGRLALLFHLDALEKLETSVARPTEVACSVRPGPPHRHCDGCLQCMGGVPRPPWWWAILATRTGECSRDLTPAFWACPACMNWFWSLFNEDDPRIPEIQDSHDDFWDVVMTAGARTIQRGFEPQDETRLTTLLKRSPADPALYYERGCVRLRTGRVAGALRDLSRAIKLDPSTARFYLDRGNAHATLGDHRAARADYEIAIKLDPTNGDGYVLRAALRRREDDLKGARADEALAREIDATLPERLFKDGVRLNYAAEHSGDKTQARALHREACARLEAAVRLDPHFGRAWLNLGVAREGLGDLKGALAAMGRGLELDPESEHGRSCYAYVEKRIRAQRGGRPAR